jgi:hypothetical protein
LIADMKRVGMNAHTPFLKPAGMPAGIDPQEWRQAIEKRQNELLEQPPNSHHLAAHCDHRTSIT